MFEHQHPLSLVDLQLDDDLTYEEDDDEEEKQELTAKQEFHCRCNRCGEEINWYHRYYYNCNDCVYSIHKFCGEVPPTLEHHSHRHTLILLQREIGWKCDVCRTHHQPEELTYLCSQCDFDIDLKCVTEWLKTSIIHHPSHMHPLVSITRDIMCLCDACGKKHEGIFYHCTTCPRFLINSDCAFLEKKLFIQDATATDGFFSHIHPLTLAYSFPEADQKANHYPSCRVCDEFVDNENLWIYKCDDCRYYTHLDCATARGEPFMSIFSTPVHDAHPNHLIQRVQSRLGNGCRSCLRGFNENGLSYSCPTCEFHLHPECALFLPKTIRHKFDKHPMKLSYFPIENHKSRYFCEVCEEEFDPERWFYHCYDCVQSTHSACSPLILDCRRAADYYLPIHEFLNIKFGGIHNIEDHSHPVSFDQGIESDGDCDSCSYSMRYKMIFKCLQCKYAIHFRCCKSFNN
ncbi:hypothetical protein OSB04_020974 [Centaurea solstitialis]|uniref:Phorbol-ester/DAG-type domain-containing protein n=1 Tax=Centaurea solstitialis TaxID=347529 RepID=A0AA38T6T0_9ASTR|nr:hypothetical protein OSB04_020974 [Centaurea solstitialis]